MIDIQKYRPVNVSHRRGAARLRTFDFGVEESDPPPPPEFNDALSEFFAAGGATLILGFEDNQCKKEFLICSNTDRLFHKKHFPASFGVSSSGKNC